MKAALVSSHSVFAVKDLQQLWKFAAVTVCSRVTRPGPGLGLLWRVLTWSCRCICADGPLAALQHCSTVLSRLWRHPWRRAILAWRHASGRNSAINCDPVRWRSSMWWHGRRWRWPSSALSFTISSIDTVCDKIVSGMQQQLGQLQSGEAVKCRSVAA